LEKTTIKFIYWFAYYNLDSPSVRYRGKYPLDYFKAKLGVKSYFIVPGYSPQRITLFMQAYFSALLFRKSDSLIVIQRVQSNFIYSTLLKFLVAFRKKDTVYDIDDADYLAMRSDTMYHFAKNCDKISAGSQEIQKHLSRFNSRIMHTTSPVADLEIIKRKKNQVLTIGWIGSFAGGHKESLSEYVFPAVRSIEFPLKFVVIGVLNNSDKRFIEDYFKDCSNIELEIPRELNWNDEESIQKRIAVLDLGLATLLRNTIELSKSGIKAKQYLNNGVPVLSTDLPENNTVVADGKNGFFCSTADEFASRIRQFQNMNEEEYSEFSKNARASVCNFDHKKYFNDLVRIKNLS
jgi:glycosyltransferase involved in cell wall biosynthesis